MKLSGLNFKTTSLGEVLKKNISIVLWIFVLVIVLSVAYIVYQEIRRVSQVRTDNSGVYGQIVRVNVGQHEALEKRLNENERFAPHVIPGADVFNTAPSINDEP